MVVSPVGSPKLIAVDEISPDLTELSIHLCTAVALHHFIINLNHQLIYAPINVMPHYPQVGLGGARVGI